MHIVDVEGISLAAPLDRPVDSAVGRISRRPALLVKVTDADGTEGLGEIWINFPAWGLKERLVTLIDGMRPLVVGKSFPDPLALWTALRTPIEKVGRQCGNLGVLYQTVSGIEIALWDILGKQRGLPVHVLIRSIFALEEAPASSASPHPGELSVPIYASGLGPVEPELLFNPLMHLGVHRAKLKVGFGDEVDAKNLKSLRDALGEDGELMVDANQAWSVEEAQQRLSRFEAFRVQWFEEPVACNDLEGMAELRSSGRIPIAGGENVYGPAEWQKVLQLPGVDIAQPDVCKTGGIGEAVAAALAAKTEGLTAVPHYLGGAVGLVASLHLAQACDCPVLEYDANPNPLREELIMPRLAVHDGRLHLPEGPGLGIDLDESTLATYAVE